MPQMADITIKASNGTTDVVLVAKTPSAGDSSAATWSEDASNTIRKYRPIFSVSSRYNGPRTARRVEIKISVPVMRTVGLETVQSGGIISQHSLVLPLDVTDTEAAEAVARIVNFHSSALIKAVLGSGYAPT